MLVRCAPHSGIENSLIFICLFRLMIALGVVNVPSIVVAAAAVAGADSFSTSPAAVADFTCASYNVDLQSYLID